MAKLQRAVYTSTGTAIRFHRKANRLTLQALSDRCGLAVSSLSEIERDVKNTSPETLEALIRALQLDTKDSERVIRIAMEERVGDFRDLLAKVAS